MACPKIRAQQRAAARAAAAKLKEAAAKEGNCFVLRSSSVFSLVLQRMQNHPIPLTAVAAAAAKRILLRILTSRRSSPRERASRQSRNSPNQKSDRLKRSAARDVSVPNASHPPPPHRSRMAKIAYVKIATRMARRVPASGAALSCIKVIAFTATHTPAPPRRHSLMMGGMAVFKLSGSHNRNPPRLHRVSQSRLHCRHRRPIATRIRCTSPLALTASFPLT